MNIRQSLHDRIYAEYPQQAKEILLYFPTYEIMPSTIKMVMINEVGNDSNLLIVFYVQIMPDDFVMQLHRF